MKIQKLVCNWDQPGTGETTLIHLTGLSFDNVMIAYCRITSHPQDSYAIISEMYVKETHRKLGLATKLLTAAENYISGVLIRPEAFLFVENDTFMEEWYKRQGYIYHGPYKDETLEDHSWYLKNLIE